MLFNSLDFAIFLPIVFALYWLVNVRSLKVQNFLILASSYFFYGWWDVKFLSLILFSTLVDYFIGLKMANETDKSHRKLFLFFSLAINLGLLSYFKYSNFFIESFVDAFNLMGAKIQTSTLQIILPVGISFYTFQTLSYSIDIYRNQLKPTRDLLAFAAFVSFFPQLVAGPIERASNLLPQFFQKRKFNYNLAVNGCKQILWGLFKKVVIADSAAEFANLIFNNHGSYPGSVLLLGGVFFAIQIYGDFSGYSDIAIGISRFFGFNLMRNFAFPYFSRDIAEFWRRWHISLSTWFRDYLYIPLGGSKVGKFKAIRNVFVIFTVSGFWHGANWTFIIWGLLNAIYFLPSMLLKKNRKYVSTTVAKDKFFPSLYEFYRIIWTFLLVVIAWIFFRSENLAHALSILNEIFSTTIAVLPKGSHFLGTNIHPLNLALLIVFFFTVEWFGRDQEFAISTFGRKLNPLLSWSFYCTIGLTILLFSGQKQEFIYFQF